MHNYSTFISRNGCDSSGLRSFDQSWESPGYCDNISIVCQMSALIWHWSIKRGGNIYIYYVYLYRYLPGAGWGGHRAVARVRGPDLHLRPRGDGPRPRPRPRPRHLHPHHALRSGHGNRDTRPLAAVTTITHTEYIWGWDISTKYRSFITSVLTILLKSSPLMTKVFHLQSLSQQTRLPCSGIVTLNFSKRESTDWEPPPGQHHTRHQILNPQFCKLVSSVGCILNDCR